MPVRSLATFVAVALAALIAPPNCIGESPAASIETSRLARHVEVLASDAFEGRGAGARGGRAAARYIVGGLQSLGLEPAGEQGGFAQHFGAGMMNVLAVVPGEDGALRDEFILIGGHYDHVGYGTRQNSFGPTGLIHNGADDNASGVAALLEVARALSDLPSPLRRSVVIAFWDGEEAGLLGSKAWTRRPTIHPGKLKAAINVDMVGRLRDHLEIIGSRSGTGWRRRVVLENRALDLPLTFPWDIEADSDHYSLARLGVPVVMLHTGLHEDYHRPSDDAEHINVQGLAQITRLLLRLTVSLANQPSPPRFRHQVWSESNAERAVLEQTNWRSDETRLGIRWRLADGGVEVTQVTPESSAEHAGLRIGDTIETFNGVPAGADFTSRVLRAPVESRLELHRERNRVALEVRLEGEPMRLGMSWRRDPGEPQVVWVSRVVRGLAAEAAGLQVGDRIVAVNGSPPTRDRTLRGVAESGADADFDVERGGRLRTVRVRLR